MIMIIMIMIVIIMIVSQPVGMYPGKYSLSQSSGDCSLTIQNVDISLDDGDWECQVTSTSFSSQDALASQGARLTVSVAPESVVLRYGGREVAGGQLSLTDNKLETVVCVTRNSNPAPIISWYLGDTAITSSLQTNVTEGETERWRSEAELSHKFSVTDRGSVLRCVVTHSGYTNTGAQHQVSVQLDIKYKPILTIARRDSSDQLEAGLSSVQLTCNVNSNPASTVIWTRLDPAGHQRKVHSGPELELKPVRRENGGTYVCTATNTVGQSDPAQTTVSVMFPPTRVEVRPARTLVVGLHNSTRLECSAEGEPAPKYQWLHTTARGETKVRSYSSQLIIPSVSYRDQGQYHCLATNIIAGRRREEKSAEVVVGVRGAPQVVSQSGQVVGIDGSDVRLEAEFCSDPSPSRSSWSWEGVVVESGEEGGGGRYRADLVTAPSTPHCYLTRLTVRGVGQEDSRQYTVTVHNIHGQDTQPVRLTVRGNIFIIIIIIINIILILILILVVSAPMPLSSAITAASLLALSLIMLVCTCLLCRSRRKLCFKGNKEFVGPGYCSIRYLGGFRLFSLCVWETWEIPLGNFVKSSRDTLVTENSLSLPR